MSNAKYQDNDLQLTLNTEEFRYFPFREAVYVVMKRAILENRPIDVFNNGNMLRDFTYIDDIVEGVARVMLQTAAPNPAWNSEAPDPASSPAPYRLYNIGNNNAVRLEEFILTLEQALGKKAQKRMLPMQPGDVPATYADVDALAEAVGFSPNTPISEGIGRFVAWYREYYKV